MLTLLMFGLATITQVNASTLQDTTHKTKSGKVHKRYKSSKTTVKKTVKAKKDTTKKY
jgi:hypothetical protein